MKAITTFGSAILAIAALAALTNASPAPVTSPSPTTTRPSVPPQAMKTLYGRQHHVFNESQRSKHPHIIACDGCYPDELPPSTETPAPHTGPSPVHTAERMCWNHICPHDGEPDVPGQNVPNVPQTTEVAATTSTTQVAVTISDMPVETSGKWTSKTTTW